MYFFQNTGDETEGSLLAISLMSTEKPAYLNWVRLYDPNSPREILDLERSLKWVPMPLYYAALLGLSAVTRLLLDKGADVNARGGRYGNALQAASYRDQEQVVKTLHDKGADVNAQSGFYGNALQAASERGHEQIVKTQGR
jgi:ankyrin repeat protein